MLSGCGGGKLVKGYTTVCGGQGKVVKVSIKLCHHLFRGERHGGLSTSKGMGGRRVGDAVGDHDQVGGAEGVASLRRGAKLPLHFTVGWGGLQMPGCLCLGRRYKATLGKEIW